MNDQLILYMTEGDDQTHKATVKEYLIVRREAARLAADIEDAEIIDELEQQISKLSKDGGKQ